MKVFDQEVARARLQTRAFVAGFTVFVAVWLVLVTFQIAYDLLEPAPLPQLLIVIAVPVEVAVAAAVGLVMNHSLRRPRAQLSFQITAAVRTGQIPVHADPTSWVPALRQRVRPLKGWPWSFVFILLLEAAVAASQLAHPTNIYGILQAGSFALFWLCLFALAALTRRAGNQAQQLLIQLGADPENSTAPGTATS